MQFKTLPSASVSVVLMWHRIHGSRREKKNHSSSFCYYSFLGSVTLLTLTVLPPNSFDVSLRRKWGENRTHQQSRLCALIREQIQIRANRASTACRANASFAKITPESFAVHPFTRGDSGNWLKILVILLRTQAGA